MLEPLQLRVLCCVLGMVAAMPSVALSEEPADKSEVAEKLAVRQVTLAGFQERAGDDEDTQRNSFFDFSSGRSLKNGDMTAEYKRLEKAGDKEAFKLYFLDAFDLFYDATHGIAANNKIAGWEFGIGEAGLVDIGKVDLHKVAEAPADEYKKSLRIAEIVAGHTYCVRTADGKHYGKFYVLEFDPERATLKMSWMFQPNGSRKF